MYSSLTLVQRETLLQKTHVSTPHSLGHNGASRDGINSGELHNWTERRSAQQLSELGFSHRSSASS